MGGVAVEYVGRDQPRRAISIRLFAGGLHAELMHPQGFADDLTDGHLGSSDRVFWR